MGPRCLGVSGAASSAIAAGEGLAVAAGQLPCAWFDVAGRGLAVVAGQGLAGVSFEQTNCYGIKRLT